MRKLLLFVCALFGFMACTQNPFEGQSAICTDAPETIRVGFEDDDTRIQLNEAQKTVWTKGDLVSVFYRSDANQKWQYQGESGERVGDLKRVENATSTTKTTKTVVVYPYSESYWLNTDSYCIEATIPATQHYAVDSYGVGDNLMVSQGEFTQFSLKSVYGWLKLQLTGDGEVVKSITFKGNNGEQVAGLIYVDTATAEATLASEMGGADDTENGAGGNLVFDDTILTEVTLNCGEGVALGAEVTTFYLALPPQTFEQGFTAVVECDGYEPLTLETTKPLVIERNTIQPMAALEAEFTLPGPANNEIWYTSSDGNVVTPNKTDAFGASIVSNTYDAEKECWVIKFDGDVTSIGDYAFGGCTSLTSITIPDSVTSIGDHAFAWCTSLTSVTIGKGVTSIGDHAFYDCDSLTNITIPDSVTSIGKDAFCSCASLTSITIPDSVTSIGYLAFSGCKSLTSVTIGNSVTSIGDYAFGYCTSLKAFYGKFASADNRCLIIDGVLNSFAPAGLTEYTIPDSVTSIGYAAFCECYSLTSVTIPDSVTSIGESAFDYCTSLKSVYCKPTTPPTGGYDMFYNNASGRKIYVPRNSVNAYKLAAYWNTYASDIVGYDF